jgi:RNA polymerase sigma factor (sigma-70 family)
MPQNQETSMPDNLPEAADPSTDLAIVQRARQGDEAAFELIMRRHNRRLFRAARGIVDDSAEAQDVVQEAYLRAFTRLESFRADSTLGTWLTRIAVNAALDAARARGRVVYLGDSHDAAKETDPMNKPAPDSEAPEVQAERGQLRDLLESAIARLPPIYRSVFMLRAVEELSVEETAHCLNVSTDVVKTRFLRSRSLLRDALGTQVEAHTTEAFGFAGQRCDSVVSHVLGELRARGLTGRTE